MTRQPCHVLVFRRPPPPPEVYDWSISDPELVEFTLNDWLTTDAPWLSTEDGDQT